MMNHCVLSVILVFLRSPEPPATRTVTPTQTIMLAMVLTPQKLARHVGDNVKCDLGSTVARATRLVAKASGTTPDGDVRFPSEFFIITGAFALGQVLNFGSLAYIADCYGELCPLNGAAPVGNELQVPSPPLGLLGGDLEVLA
jgi:hypothetical protein